MFCLVLRMLACLVLLSACLMVVFLVGSWVPWVLWVVLGSLLMLVVLVLVLLVVTPLLLSLPMSLLVGPLMCFTRLRGLVVCRTSWLVGVSRSGGV